MENDEILSCSQAAKYLGICRAGVHIALKLGKMKSYKNKDGHYRIYKRDIDDYAKNRYKRYIPPGMYSVTTLAKELDVPCARIYYLIYTGYITPKQTGSHYEITEEMRQRILDLESKKY